MSWMPVHLLLMLAAPAAVTLLAPPPDRAPILLTVGVGYLIASLIVIAQAAPTNPPAEPDAVRASQMRERRERRVLDLSAYSATAVAASVALLVALVWPVWALALLLVAAGWVIAWWPSAMRMYTLTTSIVIARDPAVVFAFVSDQRNGPRYFYMYDETVEKIGDDPIGAGTQFRSHVVLRPDIAPALKDIRVADAIEEIVIFEPNRRLATRVSTGLSPNLGTYTFDEVPGGTRVTHRFDVLHSFATGLLGSMLFAGPTNALMKANRKRAWLRAKEILENETP